MTTTRGHPAQHISQQTRDQLRGYQAADERARIVEFLSQKHALLVERERSGLFLPGQLARSRADFTRALAVVIQ